MSGQWLESSRSLTVLRQPRRSDLGAIHHQGEGLKIVREEYLLPVTPDQIGYLGRDV